MKLKPCPNCGCPNRLIKVHISSARLPWWWYIECDNCHWCGKTKLFLRRAMRSWNSDTFHQGYPRNFLRKEKGE